MTTVAHLFSELDGDGTFHRDSALGRMFHPGTMSFREVVADDSLHVAVGPRNRLSVHVDRVSPLTHGVEGLSRYSFPRVLRHNLTHCRDAMRRLARGKSGEHRCELDCEVASMQATASAGSAVTYQFSCQAAGASGCSWKVEATSEGELIAAVAAHARSVHRVGALSETLANYALQVARGG